MSRDECPDARCLARYRLEDRELRRHGLDTLEVARTADNLSELTGGQWQLRPDAFNPTGVVLGFPLPGRLTSRLRRIASLAARWVDELAGPGTAGGGFAFVPPSAYHVTIVNRTHFDETAVACLSPDDVHEVGHVVAMAQVGPIRLRLHGLLLTRSGRILVRGFPCGEGLYDLRMNLENALPWMWVHTPSTAHVKLGHIRVHLNADRLGRLVHRLREASAHDAGSAVFDTVYTPQGRIVL